MPNRLAKETSPYLLQHKDNPVDWYPWGDEALSRARAENKPILLSIGYSACHWCHVMERESFENEEIARQMNEGFVCIKVDREERPDLDQVYQNVARLLTGGGGWPLTVFLTPELKPFFGGTYFPPENRLGRPGLPRVLAALTEAYANELASVSENAEKLASMIEEQESARVEGEADPSVEKLRTLVNGTLEHRVDWTHGGLGSAPKFPNPSVFAFLWRAGIALGEPKALEAVRLTLRKMAEGGVFDQIGGGFHRYSVDHFWGVPHFEKMTYDNGLLLKLYSEVLLSDSASSAPVLDGADRERIDEMLSATVLYVMDEMQATDGGYFAAQDADTEGEEGKFFVWDPSDLKAHLSEEEARVVVLRFGVTDEGNFEHKKTVLRIVASIEEVSAECGLSQDRVREILELARLKLHAARRSRVAPGLDHKVLTAWNGLMISGMAWAARALQSQGRVYLGNRVLASARRAFKYIVERHVLPGGRLVATGKINGYLDDYAFMAMAALDLARMSDDPLEIGEATSRADEWIGTLVERFGDVQGGAYYFTSDDHEKLLSRPRSLLDQAIPSGTAVALQCMSALCEIDPERFGAKYRAELERQIKALQPAAEKYGYGMTEFASLTLMHLAGPVVASGPSAFKACRHGHVFQKRSTEANQGILICHRGTCGLPIADIAQAQAEAISKSRLS